MAADPDVDRPAFLVDLLEKEAAASNRGKIPFFRESSGPSSRYKLHPAWPSTGMPVWNARHASVQAFASAAPCGRKIFPGPVLSAAYSAIPARFTSSPISPGGGLRK
jgi:hypothetical protein